MGAYDYGQIVELTLQETRSVYNGATTGATLISGERWPVGTLGTTQDGRWFRFAQNGAATLVPGNVLSGVAPVTGHVGNTATVTPVGATKVTFTQGATAITQNQYKDGFMSISVTPGAGFIYGISSHSAVASATANTYPLAPGESIQVALTTTSRIDLIANPFRGVIQSPVTTLISTPIGVAVSAPTSGQYCWVQVQGACSVLTDGTVVTGGPVCVPSANTAGAMTAFTAGAAEVMSILGTVIRVAATTAWSTVDLRLLS